MLGRSLWSSGEREGVGRDILSEERVRGLRWWWPGDWMPGRWLRGRFGLAVLFAFLLVWVFWSAFCGLRDGEAVRGGAGGSGSSPVLVEQRALSSVEAVRAQGFGEPLYLGQGGLPVVRLGSTGEVRELTPVEWGYDSVFPYVDTGVGGVLWSPGPRGWGMWWLGNGEEEFLRPVGGFDREGWRAKQERELRLAAAAVTVSLRALRRADLDVWARGELAVVGVMMGGLRDRYSVGVGGMWAGVPGRWVCDLELEGDLTQGLSQGCPGAGLEGLLQQAWSDMGVLIERLDGIGRVGAEMDKMTTKELYESEVLADMWYNFQDLGREVEEVNISLDRLSSGSLEAGLTVQAILFAED